MDQTLQPLPPTRTGAVTTSATLLTGDATHLGHIDTDSVDLVVTSPPYPMIQMWDAVFRDQQPGVDQALDAGDGRRAFEAMHRVLDAAWAEVYRVLRPGGMACLTVGDATRTLEGSFQLYPNHARILTRLLDLGFVALPDVLWRKPTNAPSKFMGSGMLPAGAYVTYEHEYILIVRKGGRREFRTADQKARRRRSAYFWEERNVWFSDVWLDIHGAGQDLVDPASRQRSAAFPFELAYRLVCMFSVQGDTVLDPFAGTGVTAAAALAAGRHALAVDRDAHLVAAARSLLLCLPPFARRHLRQRLARHLEFVRARRAGGRPVTHRNRHYGFPVVTAQERDLVLDDLVEVTGDAGRLTARYVAGPQPEFTGDGSPDRIEAFRDTGAQLHLPVDDGQGRRAGARPTPTEDGG